MDVTKNMHTYFERDYIAIRYRATDQILIVEFKIPPISEEFRSAMVQVIEAIRIFKTGKVIFDTRRFGICLLQDQQWVAETWYPRALAAGYCRVAFVNPCDTLTNNSIDETTRRIRDRIPTGTFQCLNDAIEWMESHALPTLQSSSKVNHETPYRNRRPKKTLLRYLPVAIAIIVGYSIYDFVSGGHQALSQVLIGLANVTICYVIIHATDCSAFEKRCMLILFILVVAADFFIQGGFRSISAFDLFNFAVILALVTSGREKQIAFFSGLLLVAAVAWLEISDPLWIIERQLKLPVWLGVAEIFVRLFTSIYAGYAFFKTERVNAASMDRKLTQAHLEIVAYNRQLKDVIAELLEQKSKTELINRELVFERTLTLETNNKLAVANDEIKFKNEQIQAYNVTLERIIEELKEEKHKVLQANCELEALNTELNANNEFIAAANETLERRVTERTDGIIAMNKKIAQYAFFTSHELRGPLARILGLVNLMKLELTDYTVETNELVLLYIDKLLFSAAELDEQVRRAALLLDEVETKQSLLDPELGIDMPSRAKI